MPGRILITAFGARAMTPTSRMRITPCASTLMLCSSTLAATGVAARSSLSAVRALVLERREVGRAGAGAGQGRGGERMGDLDVADGRAVAAKAVLSAKAAQRGRHQVAQRGCKRSFIFMRTSLRCP